MILHTGGRSLGATSTRSSPASRAASRALLVGMTPSIAPSAGMARTGEMRICSFTLMPRSIGPIVSSLDEKMGGKLAPRPEPDQQLEMVMGRSRANAPNGLPQEPSVGVSQSYHVRSYHRVVKVL